MTPRLARLLRAYRRVLRIRATVAAWSRMMGGVRPAKDARALRVFEWAMARKHLRRKR